MEATDEQMREVRNLRRDEPRSFERKGNEIKNKFSSKLQAIGYLRGDEIGFRFKRAG